MHYDDPTVPTNSLGPTLKENPRARNINWTEPTKSTVPADFSKAISMLRIAIGNQDYSETDLMHLMSALPQEVARKMVYRYAGMDTSFLTILNEQVRLVQAVLNQVVTPDGTLRPLPEGVDISLKDALTISSRVTQMLLKDVPRLYTVERLQNLEKAIGDVMDEYFTEEQQTKVLERLQELTTNKYME
jgi:hypothetical protein